MQFQCRAVSERNLRSRRSLRRPVELVMDLLVRLTVLAGMAVLVLLAVLVLGAGGLELTPLDENAEDDAPRTTKTSIFSLTLSSDEQRLLTVEAPGELVVRDADTGDELDRLRLPKDLVTAAAYSASGPQAVVGTGLGQLLILSSLHAVPLAIPDAHSSGEVWALALSPDGGLIASGAHDGLRLWQAGTGQACPRLESSEFPVHCLQFSPDGCRLLAGLQNGTVQVWDVATGMLNAVLPCHASCTLSVRFSPDGSRICSAGRDGTVCVWDLPTRTQLWKRTAHEKFAFVGEFSPDGRLIASGGLPGRVMFWDAETGQPLAEFDGHESAVRTLAFSADGRTLFSGGMGGTIRLWDVPAFER